MADLSKADREAIEALNNQRPQWAKDAEEEYEMRKASGTMVLAGKRERKKFTQFAPGIVIEESEK